MNDYVSNLIMQELVFDEIKFKRKGFENENRLDYKLNIQVAKNSEESYKVTLILEGEKPDEYDFVISLSGFFALENAESLDDKLREDLITKNTVAIMMPYLRSEVSLLTAQPGMESVVLPIFNLNEMLK